MDDALVEAVARAMHFDHVDQHGYPNGLMTWDEMPDRVSGAISLSSRDHWRSTARAVIPIVVEACIEGIVEYARQMNSAGKEACFSDLPAQIRRLASTPD
jgi:hypothetical protein